MSTGTRKRPLLSSREAWISDGRQVLHFRPTLWDRWSQRLEITSGELLPDQPVPLLCRLGAEQELCLRGVPPGAEGLAPFSLADLLQSLGSG